MKKSLDYANKKKIPYVMLIGTEEIKGSFLTIKNMKSGKQEKCQIGQIIAQLKSSTT